MAVDNDYAPLMSEDGKEDLIQKLTIVWCGMVCWTIFAVAVGVFYGTCDGGTPSWLFYVFGLYLVGLAVWQWQLLLSKSASFLARVLFLLNIAMGLAETSDFQSDGQQLALAWLCDASYHEQWVESFDGSPAQFLQGTFSTLHIYGCMGLSLALSIGITGLFVLCINATRGNTEGRLPVLASFIGLGGLVSHLKANSEHSNMDMVIALARGSSIVLLEVVPQALLGPSLFALTFDEVSESAKSRQLVALALTGISLVKATVDCSSGAVHLTKREVAKAGGVPVAPGFYLFFGSVVLAAFGCIFAFVMGCVRIYAAYHCASHVYSLSVGCVTASN